MIEATRDLPELVGARLTDGATDAFVIDSVLGIGGMGVAFLAHTDRGARCVVKVILPDVVLREARVAELSFKKEVIALARLAEKRPPSPFVVRWLDAGALEVGYAAARAQGRDTLHLPWCAMELVDGRPLGTTLEERLKTANGPLEPARAAALIDGMLRGVRAIHAVGLIHRDLKPSNVLVCGEPPNEIPKITDFGVARAAGIGDTFDVTVGTTGYCALEQLEGPTPTKKDTVGKWSDVFALGAIIYEVLTRKEMYEAANAMGFVGRVLARNYTRLSECELGPLWDSPEGRSLAARLDAVLLRATSPRSPGGGSIGNDPSLPIRQRDVDELLDELEPILEGMRALDRGSRAASVARVAERLVRRWEWTVSSPSSSTLYAAALRPDGAALGGTTHGLSYFDHNGWSDLPSRPGEQPTVGVMQGGTGTFVVVRADGDVEVLPGGGGAFSFRLPFAVRRASALAGHPLATFYLAVQAAHGESLVMRVHGRAASPFARLGAARIHTLLLGRWNDEEVVVAAGSNDETRGKESFVTMFDKHGRPAALPSLPGPTVDSMAFDAEGRLLLVGPDGAGAIETRGSLTIDERPPARIDAIAALPDGQVWGFGAGLTLRRDAAAAWQIVHSERALRERRVLSVSASGARVWAIHDDGRILSGRLALST
jgi:eukaryotic-like serine/threonine-protein kinase